MSTTKFFLVPNTVSHAAKGNINFNVMKFLGITFRQMQKDTEQFFHMVLFTFVVLIS